MMSPVPPFTVLAARLVTPTPFSVTPVPLTLFAPSASRPVVEVSEVSPVPPVTVPVTVRAVVSFNVRPAPAANAPRLAIVFAPLKLTLLSAPVLPVSVPVLITPASATAPVMSPPTPIVVVPVAPVVMLPSAAVVALCTSTAVAVLLVVVSAPARLIAPAVPFTMMSPVPPFTVLAARLVTPTPVRVTPVPLTLFVPSASAPPAVVIVVSPVPPFTVPVTVSPSVLSLMVRTFELNAPRFVRTFAPPSTTLFVVLPNNVPVVIMPVCVTAPVMSFATPSVVVPVAPVVMLPSATVVALCTSTAVAVLLVVVSAPARLIAPAVPFTMMSPEPAFAVTAACVTPSPVNDILPDVLLSAWLSVNNPAAISVSGPLPVVSVPAVVNVVPLCRYSSPAPVLIAAAGRVSKPEATTCSGALADKLGAPRVSAPLWLMKTPSKEEPWPMLIVVVPAVFTKFPLDPIAPELAEVVCRLMLLPVIVPAVPEIVPVPRVSRVTVPVPALTGAFRTMAPVF